MNIDFTEVSEKEFENIIIPKGQKVRVKVEKVEEKTSKAGNPYLNFRYKVIEPEKYEGQCIFDICSLTKKALWRLKNALNALGLDTEGQIDLEPADLEEREADIKVGIDEYQGKKKNVINTFEDGEDEDIPF